MVIFYHLEKRKVGLHAYRTFTMNLIDWRRNMCSMQEKKKYSYYAFDFLGKIQMCYAWTKLVAITFKRKYVEVHKNIAMILVFMKGIWSIMLIWFGKISIAWKNVLILLWKRLCISIQDVVRFEGKGDVCLWKKNSYHINEQVVACKR